MSDLVSHGSGRFFYCAARLRQVNNFREEFHTNLQNLLQCSFLQPPLQLHCLFQIANLLLCEVSHKRSEIALVGRPKSA